MAPLLISHNLWNCSKGMSGFCDDCMSSKHAFILSLAQPQTTCRRFLLAWTVIYMKRSLRQGQKVVFWTLFPPPNLKFTACLQVCLLVCRTWWPTFTLCTLCMDVVSVGNNSNIYYFVLEKVCTSWYTIPVNWVWAALVLCGYKFFVIKKYFPCIWGPIKVSVPYHDTFFHDDHYVIFQRSKQNSLNGTADFYCHFVPTNVFCMWFYLHGIDQLEPKLWSNAYILFKHC